MSRGDEQPHMLAAAARASINKNVCHFVCAVCVCLGENAEWKQMRIFSFNTEQQDDEICACSIHW